MRKVKGLMAMATAANSNATKARGLTRRALAAHTKGKGSGSAAASVSGTRHGSAGSTSGHGKPKKVIVWRCLCCKASSEDTPWPGKTSNAPVAACKRCWETYQVGHFHMFGTFEDIAKKLDHDAEAKLKQDWQSALGRPDSGAKDFLEETVEGIDGFELYMEQSYLGINRQQFREVTGKTPEECKMKVMDLPLVTTEGLEKGPKMYKGFLVKDPQMPYTRYILRRRIGVDKRKTFMGPEQHLYPRQARLLQNFQAKQLEGKFVQRLLHTTGTYEDLLQKAKEGNDDGSGESSDGNESDESKAPDDSEPEVVSNDAGARPAVDGALALKRLKSSASLGSVDSSGDRFGGSGAGFATPAAKRARTASSLSGVSASPVVDSAEGKVMKWVERLNLQAIMLGSQYKSDLRWAQHFLDQSDPEAGGMVKLRAHVKKVLAAAGMTATKIMTRNGPDLRESISVLRDAHTEFPTAIKMSLLTRFMKDMTAEKDKVIANLEPLVRTIAPVKIPKMKQDSKIGDGATGASDREEACEDGFDPAAPQLCFVEGSPQELAEVFGTMVGQHLLPLLIGAAESRPKDVIAAATTYENLIEKVDMDCETCLIASFQDSLVCMRSLVCLLDPSDVDHVQDLNTLRTQERTKSLSPLATTYLELLHECTFLQKVYKECVLKCGSALSTQKEIKTMVAECEQCTPTKLLEMLGKFACLESASRAGAADGLRVSLKAAIDRFAGELSGVRVARGDDAQAAAKDLTDGIEILRKAKQIFPESSAAWVPKTTECQKMLDAVNIEVAGAALLANITKDDYVDVKLDGDDGLKNILTTCDKYLVLSSALPSPAAEPIVIKALNMLLDQAMRMPWGSEDTTIISEDGLTLIDRLFKLLPTTVQNSTAQVKDVVFDAQELVKVTGIWIALGDTDEKRFRADNAEHGATIAMGCQALRLKTGLEDLSNHREYKDAAAAMMKWVARTRDVFSTVGNIAIADMEGMLANVITSSGLRDICGTGDDLPWHEGLTDTSAMDEVITKALHSILHPSFKVKEITAAVAAVTAHVASLNRLVDQFDIGRVPDMKAEAETLALKATALLREGTLLHLVCTIEGESELRKALSRNSKNIPDEISAFIQPALWEHVQSMASFKRRKGDLPK